MYYTLIIIKLHITKLHSRMSFKPYKFKVNDKFIVKKNNHTYVGTIVKLASIDEFGADFSFFENNYVVKFNIDYLPIATYNFIKDNSNISYNYVMTESKIELL